MSTVTKSLFALLVAAMIVSVVLGYQGIAKLRQDHARFERRFVQSVLMLLAQMKLMCRSRLTQRKVMFRRR